MCLEEAGARKTNGLGEAGTEVLGLERATAGEADELMHGMTFGCSGCAEAGHCRRGLDQEQIASDCMGRGVQAAAW